MIILYLAHRIPYPPDKGDKLRAFRQIERLARRHRVWCACFVDDPRDFRHVPKLRGYCEDVAAIGLRPRMGKVRGLWSLARGKTITEGFYQSREMAALLAKWQVATPFDAVVAFSSSMAPYALGVPAPRRVLDLCDLDSLKWADYADHVELQRSRNLRNRALAGLYRMESSRLTAAELRWVDGFDAAVLATESETVPLRGIVRDRKLHVIGNGVELPPSHSVVPTGLKRTHRDSSLGDSTLTAAPLSARERSCAPTVGFVGVMDYLPNIDAVSWFATECWPVIRSRFANASFRIVGRSPTRAVRKLVRIPGVQLVGEVADVGFELARFDVSVAPLRIARGIQNKVLEAMAAAKAVVLTPKAAQGIAAKDGHNYFVAEGAAAFAEAVCSLLADTAARDRMGELARDFVAGHRQWEPEMEKFEALVTEGVTRSSKFKVQSSKTEDSRSNIKDRHSELPSHAVPS
jgi:glycosyltransferase involved in cell wall biosynthesis